MPLIFQLSSKLSPHAIEKLYFGHVDHGLNAGGSPDTLGRPFLFFLMEISSADARQVSRAMTQAKIFPVLDCLSRRYLPSPIER